MKATKYIKQTTFNVCMADRTFKKEKIPKTNLEFFAFQKGNNLCNHALYPFETINWNLTMEHTFIPEQSFKVISIIVVNQDVCHSLNISHL